MQILRHHRVRESLVAESSSGASALRRTRTCGNSGFEREDPIVPRMYPRCVSEPDAAGTAAAIGSSWVRARALMA